MSDHLSNDKIAALLKKHQIANHSSSIDASSFQKITCLPARVEKGSAFFCVPGETRDSAKPFEEAIRNGASCIISEDGQTDFAEPEINIPHIKVANAREAFAEFASNLFANPSKSLRVIGVTGTNGKTTTTHLIEHIFTYAGRRIGLIGTLGYRLPENEICDFGHTTPPAGELQEVLGKMRDAKCSHVSLEVTSHALVFRRVGSCEFAAAVLSNISQDHLDFHGTMENYWRTKLRLFQSLNDSRHSNKAAIINADEELADHFSKACGESITRISYGFSEKADVHILTHYWRNGRNQVKVSAHGEVFELATQLPGRFNLYNLISAIALCMHEGIPTKTIVDAVEEFQGVPGRFERVSGGNGQEPLCIVDFAHSPDALEKVLGTLKEIQNDGAQSSSKLICVFGCAGGSDATKRGIMGSVAEKLADEIILTNSGPGKEDPHLIIENIKSGIKDLSKVKIEIDRFKAIKQAIACAGKNDAVLIAGQGHYRFQHIGDEEVSINDREEARKALGEWSKRNEISTP